MTAARTLTTYLRRTVGLSLADQARAADLCDRTVRRWARGARPQPDAFSAYLRWLTGADGVASRLDQDSAGRRVSSMARGLRPYVVAACEGGQWSWVVLLFDGRRLVLCRDGVSDPDIKSYEALRSGLLKAAEEWADELSVCDVDDEESVQMAREKTSKPLPLPRVARARYETSCAELTSAQIRLLLLADLGRRGDLDEGALEEATADLQERLATLNEAARKLWRGEGDE